MKKINQIDLNKKNLKKLNKMKKLNYILNK